jgi:hypothetical protein
MIYRFKKYKVHLWEMMGSAPPRATIFDKKYKGFSKFIKGGADKGRRYRSGVNWPSSLAMSCTCSGVVSKTEPALTGTSTVERLRRQGKRDSLVTETLSLTTERGAALPVGEHFRSTGHSVADLVFRPVENIYGGDFLRKSRERMYINRYQLIDNGINRKLYIIFYLLLNIGAYYTSLIVLFFKQANKQTKEIKLYVQKFKLFTSIKTFWIYCSNFRVLMMGM